MKKFTYLLMILLTLAYVACKEEVLKEESLLSDLTGTGSGNDAELLENPYWMWVQAFPGLVMNEEARLQDETRVFNGMDWYDARISTQPREPWYSTGLYAPPAEVITITIPEGLTTANARIGSTHCVLDPNGKLERYHNIITNHRLTPGENRIYNYFGGLIYIYFNSGTFPEGATATVTISGGVKSPDFVLGETDATAWKTEVANSTVPFAELRSPRIILMLPLEYLRTIEDPAAVMTFLNDMFIEDYDTYLGMSDDADDPLDRSPKCAFRFTIDRQLCAGSGHSGYPMMGSWSWGGRLTDLSALNGGEWGVMHEIGHNFQMGSTWNFSALVEVSCNFHVMRYLHRTNRWREDKKSAFEQGVSFAALEGVTKSFEKLDLSVAMTPFMQFVQAYDWGFFRYLARKARHAEALPGNDDQARKNFFALAATEYAGEDLTPFFDAWGITLGTSTRMIMAMYDPIAAERQNFWKRQFNWNVFPKVVTRTEDERVPVIKFVSERPLDKSAIPWEVIDFSAQETSGEGTTGRAAHAIDGNDATFWHSPWTGTGSTLPQWIVIDLHQEVTPTTLVSYKRNNNNNGPTSVKVEGRLDPSQPWSDFGTFALSATNNGGQNCPLVNPQKVRYIKYTVLASPNGYAMVRNINILALFEDTVPGKIPIDLARDAWTIHSFIGNPPAGSDAAQVVERLIDNDESTSRFWGTPSGQRPIYNPQIWVTIDMHRSNTITEITLNLRGNNSNAWLHPRRFKMEVSNADPDSGPWTEHSGGDFYIPYPAAGIGGSFTASELTQTFPLLTPLTGRYVKLTFIEGQPRSASPAQEAGGMSLRKFRAKGYADD
ncbi:MAG: M60 family metallopeptidase [Odoribacteraceae bacterium]|nr:M60 family metallopeptidase [Odoribacteraceae bacterium]